MYCHGCSCESCGGLGPCDLSCCAECSSEAGMHYRVLRQGDPALQPPLRPRTGPWCTAGGPPLSPTGPLSVAGCGLATAVDTQPTALHRRQLMANQPPVGRWGVIARLARAGHLFLTFPHPCLFLPPPNQTIWSTFLPRLRFWPILCTQFMTMARVVVGLRVPEAR